MTEKNPYPDLNPYATAQKQYEPRIYESSPQHSSQVQKYLSPIQLLQQQIPNDTLDESIGQTFCKQFTGMFYKFSYVLIPRTIKSSQSANRLKNWDLWGPFFMTLIMGLFINSTYFLQIYVSSIHNQTAHNYHFYSQQLQSVHQSLHSTQKSYVVKYHSYNLFQHQVIVFFHCLQLP